MGEKAKFEDPRRERERESETRIKSVEETVVPALRKTRRRAQTMRNQGWTYEMAGREAAFRESADLVKKWLVNNATVSASEIEFVVQLLEQSAELYASAQSKKK